MLEFLRLIFVETTLAPLFSVKLPLRVKYNQFDQKESTNRVENSFDSAFKC